MGLGEHGAPVVEIHAMRLGDVAATEPADPDDADAERATDGLVEGEHHRRSMARRGRVTRRASGRSRPGVGGRA